MRANVAQRVIDLLELISSGRPWSMEEVWELQAELSPYLTHEAVSIDTAEVNLPIYKLVSP